MVRELWTAKRVRFMDPATLRRYGYSCAWVDGEQPIGSDRIHGYGNFSYVQFFKGTCSISGPELEEVVHTVDDLMEDEKNLVMSISTPKVSFDRHGAHTSL